jgi:hypothetical protein
MAITYLRRHFLKRVHRLSPAVATLCSVSDWSSVAVPCSSSVSLLLLSLSDAFAEFSSRSDSLVRPSHFITCTTIVYNTTN